MKILFVTNDGGGRFAGQTVSSLGLDFTVARFTLEDILRFRRPPAEGPVFKREAIDRAIDEIEGFDGVLAEAPETVLLHYVRHKRGLRPIRWLVNVVQLLVRIDPVRAAIQRIYGDDPLALAAAAPNIRWLVTTASHIDLLVKAGLPRAQIVCHPSTTALQTHLQPPARAAYEAPLSRELPEGMRDIEGGVLVAGTNNRDIATVARAAEIVRQPVHVLTDLRRVPAVSSPWLRYHDLVPLAEFVTAAARAGAMLVPLRAGDSSCGQQTIAIAQHVRTLVIASDVPAMRDYVVHGESGILVPAEDPAALAAALRDRPDDGTRAALVEAGFARNEREGREVERVLRDAFFGATVFRP